MAGAAAGEAERAELGANVIYDQTALSHDDLGPERMERPQGLEGAVGPQVRVAGPPGTVSPGAMERGLVASPFHSELIQEEVALRLSRPSTLDRDARALGQTPWEQDAERPEPVHEGSLD